ncbi:MAG TPA: hypothetical protein DCE71_06310 [Parachlamydiales bacterium]|nr:hypothetical protein [Parachlamydiales bacterium]
MKTVQLTLFLLLPICAFSLEENLDDLPGEHAEDLAELNIPSLLQQPQGFQDIQISSPSFVTGSLKKSWVAVGLSALLPGLGHVYLGDMQTAGGLIGSTGLGIGLHSAGKNEEFVRSTSALTIETTWLYGIYAAYRDTRISNGTKNYSYQMPTDSFLDLTSAPFRLQVLKKPEVWGGLLGSLALAVAVTYLAFPDEHIHPSFSLTRTLSPLTALPIGIGEEAFFRGFLQSQISEWSNPWGGIISSSLAFGAMHMPNAWDLPSKERRNYYKIIVPFITLSGLYDGWLTYKNHSLESSVAIHTWYDGILFTLGSLAGQAAIRGRSDMCIAFSF